MKKILLLFVLIGLTSCASRKLAVPSLEQMGDLESCSSQVNFSQDSKSRELTIVYEKKENGYLVVGV